MDEPFIVAEVSKNWRFGKEVVKNGPICRLFEDVINTNYERGYILHSFTIDRMMTAPGELNETIIGVFRRYQE